MKIHNQAILSIGSNEGDKLKNILACINFIHKKIATVIKVSNLYETPAWGFKGNDFYNCTLLVHTYKSADELLDSILETEKELGRKPKVRTTYENRVIDIDVIDFNQEIIHKENLQLPHPRMQDRKFVLYPMEDLNPQWQHPVFLKSISELIADTIDESECKIVGKLVLPE